MYKLTMIELHEWDSLVSKTYKKPYSFQQQRGCQSRGVVEFTVPIENSEEEAGRNDSMPEIVNGNKLCVKFDMWLKRIPTEPLKPTKKEIRADWFLRKYIDDDEMMREHMPGWIEHFWYRNFYPCLQTVANDLYKKGLLEEGDYAINIDW